MENASKALLIAGGILLAILTLSLVVYMTTVASSMADAQDSKTLAEQITAFNKEYEAYNKRAMYGTDVITAINKAINHNLTIGNRTDDAYYINIIIKTNQDFTTTGKVIDKSLPENDSDYEQEIDTGKLAYLNGTSNNMAITLTRNMDPGYLLGDFTSDGTLNMHNAIVEFFSQNKTDIRIDGNTTGETGDRNKIYYIYSALTNFKRATFSCTEVHYNGVTGRIDSMTFEQR